MLDLFHAKLSASNTGLAPLWSQTDVEVRETFVTLLGQYKIAGGASHELWAVGGGRYWDISTGITLRPGLAAGQSGTIGDSWVDPVIGLRGRADLGERSFVTGWALGGGFGLGSEHMIDLFAGVGYQFTPTTSAGLGYVWMSVDRRDGAFLFDVDTKGPVLGVTFRF